MNEIQWIQQRKLSKKSIVLSDGKGRILGAKSIKKKRFGGSKLLWIKREMKKLNYNDPRHVKACVYCGLRRTCVIEAFCKPDYRYWRPISGTN